MLVIDSRDALLIAREHALRLREDALPRPASCVRRALAASLRRAARALTTAPCAPRTAAAR